ncbi:cellulase family glycosylhydrolase [Nocardioides salarius]|uniref:cellulase family glycosylhydrolase n=1 Tax=Nocardioides salarius TaxID=374513 RepID=UPI0030F9F908
MGGRFAVLVAAAVSTAVALSGVLLLRAEDGAGGSEALDPSSSQVSDTATTQAATVEDPPDPSTLPSLGLQFHGTWTHYDAAERDEVLDRIEASGASWVRLDVGWAMLQPRPGGFDEGWAVPLVDEVMDQLRERDLKVLVMFWLTPSWASSEPDDFTAQYTSPDDAGDYADALGEVAQRWGDVVDAYEIWNEPNLEVFYHGTDPETYAELLCAAYPVVRREDPGARVVFGGLMYNDDDWLQRAYDAGAGGCFDVMSVHSYQAPADSAPSVEDDGEVWNLRNLDEVRETMIENGDRLPVWITEFGWSVHDNDAETEPWRRGVDEATQARYAAEALTLLAEDFAYVGAAFWYKDAANDESTDEHQEGYAMLDEERRPRPVWQAFRDLYGVTR